MGMLVTQRGPGGAGASVGGPGVQVCGNGGRWRLGEGERDAEEGRWEERRLRGKKLAGTQGGGSPDGPW